MNELEQLIMIDRLNQVSHDRVVLLGRNLQNDQIRSEPQRDLVQLYLVVALQTDQFREQNPNIRYLSWSKISGE